MDSEFAGSLIHNDRKSNFLNDTLLYRIYTPDDHFNNIVLR